MQPAASNAAYVVPSPELRSFVCDLIAEHGATGAARILSIGREPTVRICAGLAVRRGTIALVEATRAHGQSTEPTEPDAA